MNPRSLARACVGHVDHQLERTKRDDALAFGRVGYNDVGFGHVVVGQAG
ncbi:hypothetical protein [Porphyrobacter sp. AAP82]|nr:hypothetical protein [Porphyrobacter sp. AAP82]